LAIFNAAIMFIYLSSRNLHHTLDYFNNFFR